jgi:FkbM family methyltransferase
MEVPHPVFGRFRRWHGPVEDGYQANWIGAVQSVRYVVGTTPSHGGEVEPPYPLVSEDLFEWISVLEAVDAADTDFVMVELGAGFGRWLVGGALAAQQRQLTINLIGVEAEPTRFAWMHEHFAGNGIDPNHHRLVYAAAGRRDGRALFQTGRTDEYYGQKVAVRARNLGWPLRRGGRLRLTPTIGLASLVRDVARIDLLDLDIEGAEADVLEAGAEVLAGKVARAHIGTHPGDSEARLRSLFGSLGWTCVWDYPCEQESLTEFGLLSFQNGVQCWLNPDIPGSERLQP